MTKRDEINQLIHNRAINLFHHGNRHSMQIEMAHETALQLHHLLAVTFDQFAPQHEMHAREHFDDGVRGAEPLGILFRDKAFQKKPVGFQNLGARGIGLIKRHKIPQGSQTNAGDAEHGPENNRRINGLDEGNRKRGDSGDQGVK